MALAYGSAEQRAAKKAYDAARWLKNKKELALKKKKWRADNGESLREYHHRYYRDHSTENFVRVYRRRANQAGAEINDFIELDWLELVNKYVICVYCLSSDKKLTPDHVIPISRGGNHTKSNILPACLPCNLSKGPKPVEEFLAVGKVS